METITGYYDGTAVLPLEKINAQPNRKALIIIMDDFFKPKKKKRKTVFEVFFQSMRIHH